MMDSKRKIVLFHENMTIWFNLIFPGGGRSPRLAPFIFVAARSTRHNPQSKHPSDYKQSFMSENFNKELRINLLQLITLYSIDPYNLLLSPSYLLFMF